MVGGRPVRSKVARRSQLILSASGLGSSGEESEGSGYKMIDFIGAGWGAWTRNFHGLRQKSEGPVCRISHLL